MRLLVAFFVIMLMVGCVVSSKNDDTPTATVDMQTQIDNTDGFLLNSGEIGQFMTAEALGVPTATVDITSLMATQQVLPWRQTAEALYWEGHRLEYEEVLELMTAVAQDNPTPTVDMQSQTQTQQALPWVQTVTALYLADDNFELPPADEIVAIMTAVAAD